MSKPRKCHTYGCRETKNLSYIFQGWYCPLHKKQIEELNVKLNYVKKDKVEETSSQDTVEFNKKDSDDDIPDLKKSV